MEFSELQQITESNSRSIQALADRIAELTFIQQEATEERRELTEATLRLGSVAEGIANLLNVGWAYPLLIHVVQLPKLSVVRHERSLDMFARLLPVQRKWKLYPIPLTYQ